MMTPIIKFLLMLVLILPMAGDWNIVLVAAFAARRAAQITDVPPSPDSSALFSPIEQGTTSTWQETVSREGSVVIVVHPHSKIPMHSHTEYVDVPPVTTGLSPQAADSSGSTTSSFTSTATTTTDSSETTTSPSSGSTSIATESISLLSDLSSESTAQMETSNTSSFSPSTDSAAISGTAFIEYSISNSSLLSTTSTTISTSTATSSQPSLSAGIPQQKPPIDSAQEQLCTGGSLETCIAAYDCSNEPTETMRCYCRNNVVMGCYQACGDNGKELQMEECPDLPVGQPPEGLPGAGDGVQPLETRVAQGPAILAMGGQALGRMLQRPARELERVQELRA
ncbi:hypothetical protein ABW21_db0208712 [Orbilia brochopaga]|nr:hypothetical protein ABW21_db0208712 [Drechslerella brochopaga]